MSSSVRKVVFVTGTRADFGKLKSLILAADASPGIEVHLFVTGMHMLRLYGLTLIEVERLGLSHVHKFFNQYVGEPMDVALANTISGLARYCAEVEPDLMVVHGDRIEALAGATVGALRNVLVAHIEGGERSGTIDESLRHAITKLAQLHFVANDEAAGRLRQMGEDPASVHVIGSPDIDVMLSGDLPTLDAVRAHYEIGFDAYGVVLFHPVTTERASMSAQADAMVEAVLSSRENWVVIYPNNDEGTAAIMAAYGRFEGVDRVRMFPSMRFEAFLTLLENARVIVGNSSAGIREAPVYGVPTVDIGTRQSGRSTGPGVIHTEAKASDIGSAISYALSGPRPEPAHIYGEGDATERFMSVLDGEVLWATARQKRFVDVS
jgi:UDP-N-acetylglucosamine 2-epimerase (hydrolysing)